MKVLHVMHSAYPDVTGASIRSRYIVETQAALGMSPLVVSSPFQVPAEAGNAHGVEWLNGIPYYRTFDPRYDQRFMVARKPLSARVKKLTALGSFTRRVTAIGRANKVDVVHGHSLFFCGLAGVFAARSLAVPSIYEVRSLIEDTLVREGGTSEGSLLYHTYRWFDGLAVRLSSHVVTISEGLRKDLITRGVAPDKITVIGNGVDVGKQAPAGVPDPALRAALGFPPDSFVLGYIGTLFAYESLDLAIDALRVLVPRYPKLRLLIVGDGTDRQSLIARTRALELEERVRFVNRVAHDEIGKYYGLIDLFVLPRRRNRLTDLVTPLKPLEIMARAKPVLASNCGGHAELIVHAKNGFLYDATVPTALVDAIAELHRRRTELGDCGRRAREWVAANRSWDTAVRPIAALYESLVDESRQRTPVPVHEGAPPAGLGGSA